MSTIGIVGATGNIGSRLVTRLTSAGHRVRAISLSGHEGGEGIEVVQADLTDPDQAVRALDGLRVAYVTSTLAGEDPLRTERAVTTNVFDAAAKHGFEHLVLHTAVQADRGDTGAALLDNKTPVEQALVASGVGYTILRPAWFLQNLWAARDYLEQGVVSMPWDGAMAWAATDINDIVTLAATFIEEGPANRGFDVHIPGGVTGNGIAAAASEVLGRPVAFQEAPGTTRAFVDSFPLSDTHKDIYADLFDHFKRAPYHGSATEVTDAVAGFRYRGVEDFLREELFAGA